MELARRWLLLSEILLKLHSEATETYVSLYDAMSTRFLLGWCFFFDDWWFGCFINQFRRRMWRAPFDGTKLFVSNCSTKSYVNLRRCHKHEVRHFHDWLQKEYFLGARIPFSLLNIARKWNFNELSVVPFGPTVVSARVPFRAYSSNIIGAPKT